MSRGVRIGIIGMGEIGGWHAKAFRNIPGAEVAAICDSRPEQLDARGEEFGVERRLADCRALLNEPDLDAVIVCTPNFTHCKIVTEALKRGKHVLCEKPMALNARQAQRMAVAAKGARRVLQMGMVWRQKAESRMAKEYIEQGRLGRIYHIRTVVKSRRGIPGLGGWFTTKALSGGGVLIDTGVHFLDLVMWLTDNWKPLRVAATTHGEFGKRIKDYVYTDMWAGPPKYDGTFDVEDYTAGIVRFPKGATLSFEFASAVNGPGEVFAEVLGDKGGLRLHDASGITLFTEQNRHLADVRPQCAPVAFFEVQARKFADAVRGKARPPATAEQGVAMMKLVDAIYRSAEQGKEVAIRQG